MLYVVETDAPCTACGDVHHYATKLCTLVVYVDESSARMVAKALDGRVMPIEQVPEDPNHPGELIPHIVYTHLNGLPNPAYPQTRGRIA
jgi:hypothetical protein